MTTSYLPLDDAGVTRRLAYDVRGDGPLVITVPGMGDLRSADRALADALVADGFRVATMDLRGHGDSDGGFRDLGDAATASDMLALAAHLGGPAVLVGTSMSASAAILAAIEGPDAVAGLALISPFVRDGGGDPRFARLLFRTLFARPWGAAAWTAYYRGPLNRGTAPADLDAHAREIRRSLADPARLAELRRLMLGLSHQIVADRVAELRTPALAIVGALDPDYADPAAELAHIAEVTGARPLLVDEASHYPHRQRPDVVLPALRAFVAERHGVAHA